MSLIVVPMRYPPRMEVDTTSNFDVKMILVLFLLLNLVNFNYSKEIINRYDDSKCALHKELKKEIASYRNKAKEIMDAVNKIYGSKMYEQYTEFIDKFGARPSGSKNLENAIDYMINLTRANGVYDVFTEEVDVPLWERVKESIIMIAPISKHISCLGLGSSVGTPPEGIKAAVVVLRNFMELENNDVHGKIVVFDPPFTNYGQSVAYRTDSASKAAKRGALAVLVRSITPFSLYTPHTGQQAYEDNVKKIPAAAITTEDANLMRRLQDKGKSIVVRMIMNSVSGSRKSRNTVIDLKGNERADKYVIVSGHIDSWDVGQGAMDNGGGMMISWFAPILLKRLGLTPRRTVRAILWTGEEQGLIGAEQYVTRHRNELSNISFIIESDEGTFKPHGLSVKASALARCVIAEILKNTCPIDKMMAKDSVGSDLTRFLNKGVPGASLMNANERYFWYHHTEADTMDVQNKEDVISCAGFWAAFSYIVADISIDIPRQNDLDITHYNVTYTPAACAWLGYTRSHVEVLLFFMLFFVY